MIMKKKTFLLAVILPLFLLVACVGGWLGMLLAFPRPYRETVEGSGVDPALVYAVIRAESSYREDAESWAGAVGLMQVMPSTAEFVCEREGIEFDPARLKEGEYNIVIGTRYLSYLMAKFSEVDTALAAYNAGEGTVANWLKDGDLSSDGATLTKIPYPETETYVKKVRKFKKIYEILYP